MESQMGLSFYYWDHACEDDKKACMEISVAAQQFDEQRSNRAALWGAGFAEDWSILYEAEPVSKLHIVVRKSTGVASGPMDEIVAHAAVALVSPAFARHVEQNESGRQHGNRTTLQSFCDSNRGKSPLLTQDEVFDGQESDAGMNLWCVFLHWNPQEDGAAVRTQLEAGLMSELRRYNLGRIIMEATMFKAEIWMFGLLPIVSCKPLMEISPQLAAVIRATDRTFFSVTKDEAFKLKPKRNCTMLFRYRKPEIMLKAEQKRALSLWFRYGKHVPTVARMMSIRSGDGRGECESPAEAGRISRAKRAASRMLKRSKNIWKRSTINDHIKEARIALGVSLEDPYTLEKIIDGHPELLGPYRGE